MKSSFCSERQLSWAHEVSRSDTALRESSQWHDQTCATMTQPSAAAAIYPDELSTSEVAEVRTSPSGILAADQFPHDLRIVASSRVSSFQASILQNTSK